jgi:membrane glycosyltransferase
MTDAILPTVKIAENDADAPLGRRRVVFFGLTAIAIIALGAAMFGVLRSRADEAASVIFLILFLAGLPWTMMGFWNSVIGFVILRCVKDPVAYTNPAIHITPTDSPIVTRTAICIAVRHEDVGLVFARLEAMVESIVKTQWADAFDFHVLSDSARTEVAAEEESHFAAIAARYPRPGFLSYRRRTDNAGFKAGNLLEFARRAYADYDHMIVLDADSVMSAQAMLRLVRAMQANPMLGILQTLVTGQPSQSAFTRVFQFGMRHSMRTQTVGSAWWQGSSGPYWGHNAIIRIKPFVDRCTLPVLTGKGPLGGQILSHDQVEAALMRGAGYEVRVIAEEFESWEENPPSLPDFIKRDLRWCQGNIQYLKLLRLKGLRPMGRFQLVNAIMMYSSAPFGLAMLLAGTVMTTSGSRADFPATLAFALYLTMLVIGFAPRWLGMIDVVLRPVERARYGGALRLVVGSIIDALFSIFLGPVMMIAQTLFLAGLVLGKRVIWDAQNRQGRAISLAEALRGLWPQLAFGSGAAVLLAIFAPGILPWAAPTLLPCLLAVPFACATASKFLGGLFTQLQLCAIPDDYRPSAELLLVQKLQ